MGQWFSRKKTSNRRDSQGVAIRHRRQAHLKRLQKQSGKDRDSSVVVAGQSRGISVFLWLLLGATVAYSLVWSQYVNVGHVKVVNSVLRGDLSVRLERSVDGYLSGYLYGVVPRRSFLFVRPGALEERILADFPEVRSVRITKSFPQNISIQVETREQFLVACSGGPCFVINELGKVHGGDASLDPIFPRVQLIDTSGTSFVFQEPVFSVQFVEYVLRIRDAVREYVGLETSDTYRTPSRLSGVVEVPVDERWTILLSSEVSLEHSLGLLKLFLDKQISLDDRARLKYVDLRLENRIYYRFQESESEESVEGEVSENSTTQEELGASEDELTKPETKSKKKKK